MLELNKLSEYNHRVLLVNLDKDYISGIERKSERDILKMLNSDSIPEMGFDLFTQALYNLKLDVEQWKATSGVDIDIEVNNEIVKEDDNYYNTSRTFTRVYGVLHKHDDLAWMRLNLGDLKPATKLTHGPGRGWQFEWS